MGVPKVIQAVVSRHSTVKLSAGDREHASSSNPAAEFQGFATMGNRLLKSLDLMTRVKGMYRLLTLYKEQGSGGLVDKILIDQESLGNLMNKLVPNSHTSITKIDFAVLDELSIQPLGVYGDKGALVDFLHRVANIDDETAAFLLNPTDASTRLRQPALVSGLYFLIPESGSAQAQSAFVIYWPEDTTWNDNAVGVVRRNRTTFMRYLTKLTPQIRALISKDHADTLVWNARDEEKDEESDDWKDEESDEDKMDDMYFKFEVSKTTAQEEGARIYRGFEFHHPAIEEKSFPIDAEIPDDIRANPIEARLISGECQQGFLAPRFIPYIKNTVWIDSDFSPLGFSSTLHKYVNISFDENLNEEGLQILLDDGLLRKRAAGVVDGYREHQRTMQIARDKEVADTLFKLQTRFQDNRDQLSEEVKFKLAQAIVNEHPRLDINRILDRPSNGHYPHDSLDYLRELVVHYPSVLVAQNEILAEAKLGIIHSMTYKKVKARFLRNHDILVKFEDSSSQALRELQDAILGDSKTKDTSLLSKGISKGREILEIPGSYRPEWKATNPDISDDAFLELLDAIEIKLPHLGPFLEDVRDLAYRWAIKKLDKFTPKLVNKIAQVHDRDSGEKAKELVMVSMNTENEDEKQYNTFRTKLQERLRTNPDAPNLVVYQVRRTVHYGSVIIYLRAEYESFSDPYMEYNLYLLDFSESDKAQLEDDPAFVPRPEAFGSTTFRLSVLDSIRHVQAMGNKFLLIVDQPSGIAIWLGDRHRIGRDQPIKHFPTLAERKYHFAINEQQRLLAVAYIELTGQIFLQLLSMDETFSTIHALGSPHNVTAWYQDDPSEIQHVCFAGGHEELCLIERSGRIRIYSFVSLSFRGAMVQLPEGVNVTSIFSTPDDSALILVEEGSVNNYQLRLYHWNSFGQRPEGILLSTAEELRSPTSFSVSSIGERTNVVFVSLTPALNVMHGFNLQIESKNTAYAFRSKEGKSRNMLEGTVHNSLLDCHADVWTSYPIVSAIKRETVTLFSDIPHRLTFVCENSGSLIEEYFRRMVKEFENLTKKPTDHLLDGIQVSTKAIEELNWRILEARSFKAGEWLVELLCLIPIHIAVARHNTFIPLKDGVLDSRQEQRLLGATVDQITESITLGWYESILNSYMATKPIKVVSSMGEQSVGKSYMLNHFIDSSFAGSALRTTEGVWLSLCPTRDLLVVALDFEGVHSIERSPQEDMLLVLLNTAISNLVLFRNNFALSRDVAHMFTSFQASTVFLDPAANPKLFQGQLVIIIKDVVEGDKREIVKEFTSKFRQIVSDEQEANFITVLHASQLSVFPWPVIQSKPFYTLFSKLKTILVKQPTTHATAGEFLLTLKTLMAKLRAQDWGAIDQNLIKHRVSILTTMLPCALTSGFAEMEPHREELKNLDNQQRIAWGNDTSEVSFCLSKSNADYAGPLSILIHQWRPEAAREDINKLTRYLEDCVTARIGHVRTWIDSNISRFPAESPDIRSLRVILADSEDLLRASVQLCQVDCNRCHLPCLYPKGHNLQSHDCQTSHQCLEKCAYASEHVDVDEDEDDTFCGLFAGHGGPHLCKPTSHSCGEPCKLRQHRGCQQTCMKLPRHPPDEDHICSARNHQCGEPCDLSGISVIDVDGNKDLYSCPNHCAAAYDEEHDHHVCSDKLTCPIKCQLCNRLCAGGDHLHGLFGDAKHLCGQEHTCHHYCELPGVCEIKTEPRSVESTFTGVYETFQFTKFTQIANRLRCAVPIARGSLNHDPKPHTHSTDTNLFHYCEKKCENCGYICLLPLNHPLEHETRHGSMENTFWAIEGNSDSMVEIQGRRYAAHDSGTPNICSSVCSQLGRHAHIANCRTTEGDCQSNEMMHITERMVPNPDIPKDWISHKLFWKRTGFKDPYSREEQAEFSRCDIQCAGEEHRGHGSVPARPSFCTLPIFHPPQPLDWADGRNGYISSDGHSFSCANPNRRQSYHIIFVLDASYSMKGTDLKPLPATPTSNLIIQHQNNRFGAVLSALYNFCISRSAGGNVARGDSYSVITFGWSAPVVVTNDSTSTPDQLLQKLVQTNVWGKTHFDNALRTAKSTMETHWHNDRAPAIIFLSDGESTFTDSVMQELCNVAAARGKPLSFHTILFGDSQYSTSLKKMATIASQIAVGALRGPLASQVVPCGYSNALDSIKLAETFLNIAQSLKKPRAALMHS